MSTTAMSAASKTGSGGPTPTSTRCPGYDILWAEKAVCVRVFLINVMREHVNVNMQGRHIEIQAVQNNVVSGSLTLFKIRFRLDMMFNVMLSRIMSFDNGVLTMVVPLFDEARGEEEDEDEVDEDEDNNEKDDEDEEEEDDEDDDDEAVTRTQSATNEVLSQ